VREIAAVAAVLRSSRLVIRALELLRTSSNFELPTSNFRTIVLRSDPVT